MDLRHSIHQLLERTSRSYRSDGGIDQSETCSESYSKFLASTQSRVENTSSVTSTSKTYKSGLRSGRVTNYCCTNSILRCVWKWCIQRFESDCTLCEHLQLCKGALASCILFEKNHGIGIGSTWFCLVMFFSRPFFSFLVITTTTTTTQVLRNVHTWAVYTVRYDHNDCKCKTSQDRYAETCRDEFKKK